MGRRLEDNPVTTMWTNFKQRNAIPDGVLLDVATSPNHAMEQALLNFEQRGIFKGISQAIGGVGVLRGVDAIKEPYFEMDVDGEQNGLLTMRWNPEGIRLSYTGHIVSWQSTKATIASTDMHTQISFLQGFGNAEEGQQVKIGLPSGNANEVTMEAFFRSMFNLPLVPTVDCRYGENPVLLNGSSEGSLSAQRVLITSGAIQLEPILRFTPISSK